MIKLCWDLDGVLRNLNPIIRRKYNLYSQKTYNDWSNEGIDIYDLVEKDYSVLLKAKPIKYVKVLQEYYKKYDKPIEIWSYQPYSWIMYTSEWIKQYFHRFEAHWLTPKEKFKRLQENKNIILLDDYPNHRSYGDRLWIIDQKYNHNVKCKVRIKTVEELKEKLMEINK